MLERLSWKKLFFELIIVGLPALLIGWWADQIFLALFIAALIILFWHYYNLLKLSNWLWLDKSMIPPQGRGSWEPLFYGLYQMQSRNRARRRELRDLIKRFRSAAESLPDAVVLTTAKGEIFWCNGLAQQLLGFHWPEDNGQHIVNLIRYPQFESYLRRREFDEPLTLQFNNGNYIELRIMFYIEDQLLIVARDVTQARKLEKTKQDFFTNVSHELRTPLTVLRGYLEILSDSETTPTMRDKAINSMRAQTERMDSLVSQLITLSRIETAQTVSLKDKVDVVAILTRLQEAALALSGGKRTIRFHVDNDLVVYGNQEELRSAMSNLVYNAVYYTPDNANIDVYWRRTPQGAQFIVQDNGEGIAQEHLSRLTERFYRTDDARSRNNGGSGLGLAIVKHALNHHQSRLEISSQLGRGSRFQFTLPKNFIAQ